ncbi:hypothetical protein Hanom_Chr11g01011821 [Helianthus anomalus]
MKMMINFFLFFKILKIFFLSFFYHQVTEKTEKVGEQQVVPLPLLNSKLYPAKHKILPLNMRGVIVYHLLNPFDEPHRATTPKVSKAVLEREVNFTLCLTGCGGSVDAINRICRKLFLRERERVVCLRMRENDEDEEDDAKHLIFRVCNKGLKSSENLWENHRTKCILVKSLLILFLIC